MLNDRPLKEASTENLKWYIPITTQSDLIESVSLLPLCMYRVSFSEKLVVGLENYRWMLFLVLRWTTGHIICFKKILSFTTGIPKHMLLNKHVSKFGMINGIKYNKLTGFLSWWRPKIFGKTIMSQKRIHIKRNLESLKINVFRNVEIRETDLLEASIIIFGNGLG